MVHYGDIIVLYLKTAAAQTAREVELRRGPTDRIGVELSQWDTEARLKIGEREHEAKTKIDCM